jgi:hypothetical protein
MYESKNTSSIHCSFKKHKMCTRTVLFEILLCAGAQFKFKKKKMKFLLYIN